MKPDLSLLRDIHLPGAVSWWPPAPGWWVLVALVPCALGLVYLFRRRRRRNRWRSEALGELARLKEETPPQLVRELSVLLRRVALRRFPRGEVAALTGEAWLAFLDRTLGDGTAFRSGAGRALLDGPYAPSTEVDAEPLIALCARWIERLPAGGFA